RHLGGAGHVGETAKRASCSKRHQHCCDADTPGDRLLPHATDPCLPKTTVASPGQSRAQVHSICHVARIRPVIDHENTSAEPRNMAQWNKPAADAGSRVSSAPKRWFLWDARFANGLAQVKRAF